MMPIAMAAPIDNPRRSLLPSFSILNRAPRALWVSGHSRAIVAAAASTWPCTWAGVAPCCSLPIRNNHRVSRFCSAGDVPNKSMSSSGNQTSGE